MTYPASVVTRPVQVGGAVSVEAGRALTVRTVTVASRALIHSASGTRLEKLAFESSSPLTGEAVWWEIAATDISGVYLDAETRQAIVLGPDEHTHLYTTTLEILDGAEQVAEYVIGPYPVPAGGGLLDLDSQLIPDDTTGGTLVAIPESWAQTIADAQGVVALLGDTGWVDLSSYFLDATVQGRRSGKTVMIRGLIDTDIIAGTGITGITSAPLPAEWRPTETALGAATSGGMVMAVRINSLGHVYVSNRNAVSVYGTLEFSVTFLRG